MEKCRICLGNKKNLLSIYECDKGTSYVDMLTLVANVKIIKIETFPDQLCRTCRRKLRELYDFKMLIERSDTALCETNKMKKLSFNNINDIKIEINIESDSKHLVPKCKDMTEHIFKDGGSEVCYSNTIIKRLGTVGENGLTKPIPVLEFLKTIKGEPMDIFDNYDADDYGPDMDGDDDYIPPHKLLKQKPGKRKYVRDKSIKNKEKQVCIEPVYLYDLKLMVTRPEPKPKGAKRKYNANKPLEICPHCGKMTKTLETHILQHTGERSFKCDVCNKGFFTKNLLSYHLRKHTAIKKFKCDLCTAAFICKGSLKDHMLIHTEEKKHICEICSKAFKRRHALRRHVIHHNSANKMVKCELCNMSFFSNVGLRHHMRVHTGERPYNCQICSQPYSYKHDFNRHCFKKHGVFLKRRSVYVLNEEVLKQEKILMRDLMLRVNGIIKDGEPLNPFDGPQAAQAFEQAVKALESRQIAIDF